MYEQITFVCSGEVSARSGGMEWNGIGWNWYWVQVVVVEICGTMLPHKLNTNHNRVAWVKKPGQCAGEAMIQPHTCTYYF